MSRDMREAEEGRVPSEPNYGGVMVVGGSLSLPLQSPTSTPMSSSRHTSKTMESSPLMNLQHHMPMPAEDSVYSYLMFMPPIEQRRTRRYFTNLTVFAFILVVVNFVMQVGLLYVVGQHIMHKHNIWMSAMISIPHHAWYHVIPMEYNGAPPKCKGKDSPLCYKHGHGISCSPLSIHALTDFDRLDSDGDGIWSQEESQDEQLIEKFECDFNVDLPTLYTSMVQQINASSTLHGRRDTNLITGVGVHKAYLDWYMHKPLLCQYGDQDMCGTLFKRGFFDEALREKSSSEFTDIRSALKYCNDILQYECFDILPNTYRLWRHVSNQQCGDKIFKQTSHPSPTDDGVVTPMLSVDFRKRIDYAGTKHVGFRLFLCILLAIFLSVMFLEMRSILKTFIWCARFQADWHESRRLSEVVGHESVVITTDDDGEVKKTILAVRHDHRMIVFCVGLLRLCLWFFLLWSGIMFLTGPPRYLTLIFDALSLVFIFEIDELLYRTMLRVEFRNDHLKTDDMQVPQWHGGKVTGSMSVWGDAAGLLSVIAFAMLIVYTYTQNELNPLVDSLQCLCTVQGSQCTDAAHYSKAWWDTYWSTTLPASNAIINQLKEI